MFWFAYSFMVWFCWVFGFLVCCLVVSWLGDCWMLMLGCLAGLCVLRFVVCCLLVTAWLWRLLLVLFGFGYVFVVLVLL